MKTLFVTIFLFVATTCLAAGVTVQWDAVPNAVGYKVYHGTESGVYSPHDDVGNQTTHVLTLDPGTYYFAVTAYNEYGESGYSEETYATQT